MNNEHKSNDNNRTLQHQRTIIASGYKRDDELWDLEAKLVDIKAVDFPNAYRGKNTGGVILAGEPLHGLMLRVVVDINLIIREVEVNMEFTPYMACGNIRNAYQSAIGIKIEAGFLRKINELFKGVKGCAHITELWSTIGTLAYQTLFPEFARMNFNGAAQGLAGACHIHTSIEQTKENIIAHIPEKY